MWTCVRSAAWFARMSGSSRSTLTWFWRRREFARVIFLAAISSYTPAPLPADELAG